MTAEEIKTLIDQKIAGQGNQVDSGGALAEILTNILDIIPSAIKCARLTIETFDNDSIASEDEFLSKIKAFTIYHFDGTSEEIAIDSLTKFIDVTTKYRAYLEVYMRTGGEDCYAGQAFIVYENSGSVIFIGSGGAMYDQVGGVQGAMVIDTTNFEGSFAVYAEI